MNSKSTTWDIVIVGAGIIGCSIAWFLRHTPYRILLLERSEPGGLATNAAAGILGPLNETDGPGPLLDLMQESLALYPDFVREIQESSGLSADYVPSGILSLATTDSELEQLEKRWLWQSVRGKDLAFLSGKAVHQAFPDLASTVRGAIHYPHESHVFAPRLLRGLLSALPRHGVTFSPGTSVRRIRPVSEGVLIAETSSGETVQGKRFVLTPGAYLNEMEIPPPIPPVIPANGQILSVRAPDFSIRQVVFYPPKGYFVPKLDGTVVIGATEELVGYQTRVTPGGLLEFLEPLRRVSPKLLDSPLQLTWSGLRPKTPDSLPILGTHPEHPNLFFATGHYRNGILLAPITGKKIAGLITGEIDLRSLFPFRAERFS